MSKAKSDLLQGTLAMLILKAKFYKLTSAGRKQLIEERSNWERLCAAINTVLKTI